MGKDLRGKELGVGLSQEKSGLYLARYTDRFGKRQSKRFTSLKECRNWLADATYNNEHYDVYKPSEMIVNAWYESWFENKQKTTKPATIRNYRIIYNSYIKPVIGDMLLKDVKPMHCQLVMNRMVDNGLKRTTVNQTKIILHNFFDMAVTNEIISVNPCNRFVKSNIGKLPDEKEAMTRDEQKAFLDSIKGHRLEKEFRFVLQTGLRVGELGALKWEDVDFKARRIKVDETLFVDGRIEVGTPKSKFSIRTIPLTKEAYEILKECKKNRSANKIVPMEWKDLIFLNDNGTPIVYYNYDEALIWICKKNGLKHISMHILRHTFATRCIEGGMKPKTLQKIMGHSSITITMNRYVHTTEDEKRTEIERVSNSLIV